MCRVCNNENPPYLPKVMKEGGRFNNIRNIVKQYTGEFPCLVSLHSMAISEKRNITKDIDQIIVDRLISKYNREGNDTQGRTNYKLFNGNYGRRRAKKTKVEKNIYKVVNDTTDLISFLAINRFKNKTKSFDTIEDARQYISHFQAKTEEEKKRKVKQRLSLVKKKKIERNIQKIINTKTGHVCFNVVIRVKHKIHQKAFSTLEEAREYRDNIKGTT